MTVAVHMFSSDQTLVVQPQVFFKTTNTGVTTIGGAVPFGSPIAGFNNPDRCFKYRAILKTTDPNQAPTLYDITFNYSP